MRNNLSQRKPSLPKVWQAPFTLGIDIGGTGLKASTLDASGKMLVKPVRIPTPYPCSPKIMLRALAELTKPLPAYDRISVGFPGVVRKGCIKTAPHFGPKDWTDFPLEATIAREFGKPTRLLNDAEVQGLGIIKGQGLEVVLTLGTGVGSAVFIDGRLSPHLELAHHPLHAGKTYNEYLGKAALDRTNKKIWNQRVREMVDVVQSLLHYDALYIGGGEAANLTGKLPIHVKSASNDKGITGGIRMWDDDVWSAVRY